MVEGRKECKVGWRRNGGVVEGMEGGWGRGRKGRKEWKAEGEEKPRPPPNPWKSSEN